MVYRQLITSYSVFSVVSIFHENFGTLLFCKKSGILVRKEFAIRFLAKEFFLIARKNRTDFYYKRNLRIRRLRQNGRYRRRNRN